jgi:hypothetical protein
MTARTISIWACAPPIGARADARRTADIAHVEDLLWQIAISLEQNGLLDAAAELRQLQMLITPALASGMRRRM